MPSPAPLPIHPLPVEGESLGFYLVTLADKTGWVSAKDLLAATGLINHKYVSPDSVRIIQHLSQITGHDQELLFSASFPKQEMGVEVTNQYYPYRNYVLNKPQLCPACLDNKKSMKAIWQYLPNTYCLEHDQKLLSACPNCEHHFDWDCELLSYGCSHCGTNWSAMINSESVIPKYLEQFNEITDEKDKLDYLDDLLLAVQRAIRPYDSILEAPRERLPVNIKDWHNVLERAYNMLTNSSFYVSWLNTCLTARREVLPLGHKAMTYPIMSLKEKLQLKWPLHNFKEKDMSVKCYDEELPSFYFSILSARLTHQNQSLSDIDLRYQVTAQELARLLGCRLLDIRILIENQVLKSINKTNNTRYAIFDSRTLVNRLNELSLTMRANFVRFNDVITVMPLFAIEFGDIVTALLCNKLQAFIDPTANNLREGLYISRYSLIRQFRKALATLPEQEILRTNVTKLLGITDTDLKALAKAKILQPVPCGKNNGCYSKKDLIALNNNYFLLSRWAKIRNSNLNESRQLLIHEQSFPVIGKNLYHKTVKSKLNRLLNSLTIIQNTNESVTKNFTDLRGVK